MRMAGMHRAQIDAGGVLGCGRVLPMRCPGWCMGIDFYTSALLLSGIAAFFVVVSMVARARSKRRLRVAEERRRDALRRDGT